MKRLMHGVCAASLFVAAALQAADWPKFRGPAGDGISLETGINKDWGAKAPAVLWEAPLGDKGFSGPAVVEGVVYLHDYADGQDVVRALDLASGKERWRQAYPQPGDENYGFTRATPTVADGKVYTVGRRGQVHCLNAADGTVVWSRDVLTDVKGEPPQWLVSSSAVLDGDRVLVPGGGENANLVALDKATGKTLWTGGGTYKLGYATPVVATLDGRKQILSFNGNALVGLDPETGAVIWEFKWRTQYDVNAPTPIVVGPNKVYIGSGYRTGCALVHVAGAEATQVYKNRDVSPAWSTPILLAGLLYANGEPGYLICQDPKTGEVKWKSKGSAEGFEKGGLIAIDGTLIVIEGNTGAVVQVAADPAAYRELGRINPLGSANCWVAPVVADGKLLVRNAAKLVCLDLTP